MSIATHPPGFQPVHHDRLLQQPFHDTYRARGKFAEPTVCTDCGAIFENGRWRWGDRPKNPHRAMCPACHRQRDNCPAGFVTLAGPFFEAHRDEIFNLIRKEEMRERRDHALKRIMATAEQNGGTLITTTDIHLARTIGDALHRAYRGEVEFHYNEEQNLLRVHWTR